MDEADEAERRATLAMRLWGAAFALGMAAAGGAVGSGRLSAPADAIVMLGAMALLIPFVRAHEARQRRVGGLTGAVQRYNRRIILASFIYAIGLFMAIGLHGDGASPTLRWVVPLLPSAGAIGMVAAMGRYLVEECDEYQRLLAARAAVWATGGLLAVATLWGFFEMFGLAPHVPSWAALPVWAALLGVARPLVSRA